MEKISLNTMKSSNYHKIVAHVLEIVEETQFQPNRNVEILESENPDIWKMVFQKKNTSLEELQGIKTKLGTNFSVNIQAKDKSCISIIIEAPSEDFINLLGKRD